MPKAVLPGRIIPSLLFFDGLMSVFLAVFAHLLGFDPNPGWGQSRYLLLILGIALVSASVRVTFGRTISWASNETVKTVALFSHLWLAVWLIYAWFITYGTFTSWQNSTRYYAQLADGFNKGQLHVALEPDTAFLDADDPYNTDARPRFNDEMWDMSLYKGKLYIYWGPVPALLLAPFQARSEKFLPDIFPVYFFLGGLFIVNSLFLLHVWKRLFPHVPFRNFLASVLLAGFILPIPWSLNTPDVYEAAIGAGQFFLMGGIFFAYLALEGKKTPYLALAGLFWACSVGSRAVNVFSVALLTILTAVWLWRSLPVRPFPWRRWATPMIALLLPLGVGAILLGWYNWARFDSPFEFGLRYQITIYNLNRDIRLVFQPDYFPYNFYAYILQPFTGTATFPFVQPVHFSAGLKGMNIMPPKLYAGGPVVGFLFYAPFLLLGILPFVSWKKTLAPSRPAGGRGIHAYLLLLLGGSFLVNFTMLLFYFYGQMRFHVDWVSQAVLLAVYGYWQLMGAGVGSKPDRSRLYVRAAGILLAVSILLGFLLSFSGETNRMEKANPALMEKIHSIFTIQ